MTGGRPRRASEGRHRLIVAEKPSVARDLARVLGATVAHKGWFEGNGLRVTWCIGHLLELEEPAAYDPRFRAWSLDALPILPEAFQLRVRKGVEEAWATVRRLLLDSGVEEVVNACDAGREGELIFRQVHAHAGCRRPVLRFWTSSLTDEAIRAAWSGLRPSAGFDALGEAARCRSEADWLVGMNATRALTCRTREVGGDALWSVGRVQTPTLAMIVQRDLAIDAFVPASYWTVQAQFQTEAGTVRARWFREEGAPAAGDADRVDPEAQDAPEGERLTTEAAAAALVAATLGASARVAKVRKRTRREPPPLLYDLTSLQRRANQRYGLSAQRTLEVAQALYEKHKLITYPRTDARHLTEDQVPGLTDVLEGIRRLAPYRPTVEALLAAPLRTGKRVVDNSEVGDHHAIIPTGRTPDPARLDPDEKRVFDLVARRLLAALSLECRIDLTDLIFEAEALAPLPAGVQAPTTWRAKGRVVVEAGWQAIDPPSAAKEVDLPAVKEGDPARAAEVTSQAAETKPPRPHDDATLLRAMETAGRTLDEADLARALRHAGLGTPATRAAVLQTLLDRSYVVRSGKALSATAVGRALIEALPVDALKSAELTGRWEKRLADVAEGRGAGDQFAADVAAWVTEVVGELRTATLPAAAATKRAAEGRSVGVCPLCGAAVHPSGPRYRCSGEGCAFVLYGTVARKKLPQKVVKQLLAEGRVPPVEGLTSKAGTTFTAGLELKDGAIQFWFPDRSDGGAPADPPRADPKPTRARQPAPVVEGAACPSCGTGLVMRGRTSLGCSRWREGCAFRSPFVA